MLFFAVISVAFAFGAAVGAALMFLYFVENSGGEL